MWFASWLRNRTVAHKRRSANRFLPTLELLEGRAVPATLTVNTTLDVLGHDNGILSLRQAILDANARTTADTIVVPAGTYTLTRTGESITDGGLTGDLDISASTKYSLTISGAGAGSTVIDGGGLNRVFTVNYAGTVSISGVTIEHGNAGISSGGGIFSSYATLTVSNCAFSGNSAGGQGGGALFVGGTVTVNTCTFSGNSATANTGYGGAIDNNGTMTVTNSTFSDNSARYGGAITNHGTMTVTSCTISGNTATEGGGIFNTAKLTIRGSTVSGNTAPLGANLYGEASISDSTIGDTYYR